MKGYRGFALNMYYFAQKDDKSIFSSETLSYGQYMLIYNIGIVNSNGIISRLLMWKYSVLIDLAVSVTVGRKL